MRQIIRLIAAIALLVSHGHPVFTCVRKAGTMTSSLQE
jgi:hypothetical protein